MRPAREQSRPPRPAPQPSAEDVEAVIGCLVQQVLAHVDLVHPRAGDEARLATARLWALRAAERLRPAGWSGRTP